MAALLQSTSSTFHGQCSAFRTSAPPPRTLPVMTVRAAGVPGVAVFVDKAEKEKTNRLKSNYLEKIVPLLKEEFSYANIQQVPKVDKIVVNCGIGDAEQNKKGLDGAINEFALITGQKPLKTKAKKSVASFKLREGQTVGIAVTLRGKIMYAFLDRLINLALPRTRDFLGVNNRFDGNGNYSVGLREQSVFPELVPEIVGKTRGMDVCITTTAKTDKEAYRLLALMGMPFKEGSGSPDVVRKKKLKSHHFDSRYKGRKY